MDNTLRQAYYGVNNKSDPELLFLCTMHNVMYINVSEIELKRHTGIFNGQSMIMLKHLLHKGRCKKL